MEESYERNSERFPEDLLRRAQGVLQGYEGPISENPPGDNGLEGQELVDHWDNVGLGEGGFYDHIREHGCSSCGCHTPGCCDGCA